MRIAWPLVAVILLISGCSSDKPLIINDRQALVMDPSVMTAGLTAGLPVMTTDKGRQRAYATISNGQNTPVTVHYRFYWYDSQGLDVMPFADSRTLVIPADTDVRVDSINGNPEASRVRLYLFL